MHQLGLMNEIQKGKLAVALVDITDINHPRVASLNGDDMMYAASLPKIAILLGAFVEIEQGNMTLDSATRNSLTQMIRFSSNENASKMLARVGNHRLQEILMSDRYKLYDPLHNGGLWVGKAYGKTPAFERDPIHNLSHGATVLQAARFYYMMETGQLVSSDLTADMKEILSDPKINHKFVKGLASRPEATIYRKSGSWRHWHADSALIEANGYKYIAVALAEDPKGGQWLSEMIAPMHDLIVPSAYAELTHH
jgi:beta-lactamase class A